MEGSVLVERPLVSVIIPFYNCQYVQEAIESALKQSYENIEIIVVNDGSTRHAELVNPYKDRVVYVEKPNGGVATALNLGLKIARGSYIAWLSSDDRFDEKKIELQLSYMMTRRAHICFTNYHIMNNQSQIIQENIISEHFKSPLHVLQTMINANPINGCTVMMSRNLVKRVGFFNQALKYTQDYDYWVRAAIKYPLYYLPATLTAYRFHDQMGSILYHKEQIREFASLKEKYRMLLTSKLGDEKDNSVFKSHFHG